MRRPLPVLLAAPAALLLLAGLACGEPLRVREAAPARPPVVEAPRTAPDEPPSAAPTRKPAAVMGHEGAGWLEREGRDEEQRPDEVIRAMKLGEGDVVADLGAGTGYFARRIAPVVGPAGKVYAVDIQPEMLELLAGYLEEAGITNVVPVLGTDTDTKLPRGKMDWILMVDVYHELQKPREMLAAIRDSLAPDGRVALIEYRLEGSTAAHIKEEHRMSVEQVMAEWLPAGFELVERHEFLPTQHFFVFRRAR